MAGAIELSKRIQARLEKDVVIWLTTVGRDSRPHAVPVWFWWDGDSFLIYSVPGQKVDDINGNRHVQLHLNTGSGGDFVVRFDGEAEVLSDAPPATRVPKYMAKYRERIRSYGWTPKYFADRYRVPIRIRPTKLRG